MSNRLWDMFAFIVAIAAVVLAVWEIAVYRNPDRDKWLATPRRLRRRLLVSALLLVMSGVMLSESMGVLNLRDVYSLMIFMGLMSGLTMGLVVLAILDAGDTMKNASKHAMEELDRSMEQERLRQAALKEAETQTTESRQA